MSEGVEFDEDSFGRPQRAVTPGAPAQFSRPNYTLSPMNRNEPKMVQFLMRHGIVKSPIAAQVLLLGVIVINIIITYLVIKFLL